MVAPTDSTDAHGCGIYKSVIIRGICGRINIKLQMVAPTDSTDAHGCGIYKSDNPWHLWENQYQATDGGSHRQHRCTRMWDI